MGEVSTPTYVFRSQILQLVPGDGRPRRPKHVAKKLHSVREKCCVYCDKEWNKSFTYLSDNVRLFHFK
jgi:hypothetical protein